MTPTETAATLRQFNAWLRGGNIKQPGLLAVGKAIDAAVEMLERLEAAEQTVQDYLRVDREKAQIAQRLEAAEEAWKISDQTVYDLTEKVIPNIQEKLEAAEKERDALRSLVVMRFDHDHPPQFTQGYGTHELTEPVTAEHCQWFVTEIERLSAENAALIDDMNLLRNNNMALRAKIEQMERQEN